MKPSKGDTTRLLELYPRIYFACHKRHVRDPRTDRRLSRHQASILDHLDDVEPTSLGDLARHMGVTDSTMSLNIKRLAVAGYVRRDADPDDKRRALLRLTKSGVHIKASASVLDPRRVEAVLGRLPAAKRRTALKGLAYLAEASQEEMEERAEGPQRSNRRRRYAPASP